MTIITIIVDYPGVEPQGIKEALAMYCERFGRGVRVVEVREVEEKQMSLFAGGEKE